MDDFIPFTRPIKPLGASTFALLEDRYIQGGFKIVAKESDRDALDPTTIKKGALVKCQDTGIFWRAKSVIQGFDDFGDPFNTVEWEEFKFSAPADPDKPVQYQANHTNFTLNIANVDEGKSLHVNWDLKCYSCFLLNMRVSIPVKVEIYSRKDYKDVNPYTFIARHDHLIDDGRSFVTRIGYDSFTLKTSSYSVLANEDDELSTMFYFRITKNSKLTETGAYDSPLVTIAFDYIPIEL